jgi:signal transduction histidine kinase
VIRSISRTWLVLDIVGSLLGLLITVPVSFVFAGGSSISWVAPDWLSYGVLVVVGIGMWGAAAISRLSPLLALIIAWAAAVLQMAAGLSPLPLNLAVFVVLFATSAWGSRSLLWAGAISAGAGGLIAGTYITVLQIRQSGVGSDAGGTHLVWLALLAATSIGFALVIAWGAGFVWRVIRRGRATRLAQLQAETVAAEEQERVRIARDMHDIVAHSLAVVIAQSDGARYVAATQPELAQEALTTIGQTARAALSDVRMLLTQLRHRQGDGPQPTLADLESLFAHVRGSGVEPRVTIDPMPPGEPPASIQLAVYRILQEALTNAMRHGRGDVDIRLSWWADRVDIDVQNGISSTPAGPGPGPAGGHGLVGMRERAQLVGGTLTAERDDDRFVVRATLPIGARR